MRSRNGRTCSKVGLLVSGLVLVSAFLPGAARAGDETSPCNLCATGKNQSPVRVERSVGAPLMPGPTIAYAAETVQVTNQGRNLQVNYPPTAASAMKFDAPGNRYALRQFHFHAPGEHELGSFKPALEVHFVHERDGARAVLGVLVALGTSTHPLLKALFETIPPPGQPRTIEHFDARSLAFRRGARVLRYSGSLTTHECDEGVSWFVYDTAPPYAVTISQVDLQRYKTAFPEPYARPVQPLNARLIVRAGAPRLGAAK